MKTCPTCKTQYSDDSLSYCLQDGTPLVAPLEADLPTVVMGEVETVVTRRRDPGVVPVDDPGPTSWQQTRGPRSSAPEPEVKGSNTAVAVAVTAVGMLILFGAVGIAVWLYLKGGQPETPKNTNSTAQSTSANSIPASNSPPSPTATRPAATPMPTGTVEAAPPTVADPKTRDEVSQTLNSWKLGAESFDLDAYMGHYAETVDYYRKKRASNAFVRADKQRAFLRFDSIRVTLSNISVTADPSGQTATAVFDKEWDFQGNRSSSGKVKQLIQLSKVNGQWLITAEKDLSVYYKR